MPLLLVALRRKSEPQVQHASGLTCSTVLHKKLVEQVDQAGRLEGSDHAGARPTSSSQEGFGAIGIIFCCYMYAAAASRSALLACL